MRRFLALLTLSLSLSLTDAEYVPLRKLILRSRWLQPLFVKKRARIQVDSAFRPESRQPVTNEDEENDEAYEPETRSADSPFDLAAMASSVLSGADMARMAVSGLQVGILFYLGRVLWKTLSEILDEYSQELSGNEGLWAQHEEVSKVLGFLEQPPAVLQQALNDSNQGDLPHLATLQIAQKLSAAGLPLRAEPGRASVESMLLCMSRSEVSLVQQCLWTPPPAQGDSSAQWNAVSGLESVKERLLGTIAAMRGQTSKKFAALFDSQTAASGVLLYGPPGCGKTLLVKTLSSACRWPCLVVTPSVLLRKYVGETNQQVRHLFSLSQKLAPCIVCIDELDGLFRERSENEHEVSRDLKTEFLQWVDGMMTKPTDNRPILLIGATNRPFDVDAAVLRRLPQAHFVGLPDLTSRSSILSRLLNGVPTNPSLSVHEIALGTPGYSPSDLKQLLQTAALSGPMRHGSGSAELTTDDVFRAMQVVKPTPLSDSYRWAMAKFTQGSAVSVDPSRWETDFGNFYHAGTLEVDKDTFDNLATIFDRIQDFVDDEDDGSDHDEDI